MQPDQTLDERAARAMGWYTTPGYNYWMSGSIKNHDLHVPVKYWHPSTDANHARELLVKCDERGVLDAVWRHLVGASSRMDQWARSLLLASPAQLTKACCEALEAEGEKP